MSNSIQRAIEEETHLAYMARMGLHPENLERHEARIIALRQERERIYQETLEAYAAFERMTAPKLREPTCVLPLGIHDYFDTRGELREQRYVPKQHS